MNISHIIYNQYGFYSGADVSRVMFKSDTRSSAVRNLYVDSAKSRRKIGNSMLYQQFFCFLSPRNFFVSGICRSDNANLMRCQRQVIYL